MSQIQLKYTCLCIFLTNFFIVKHFLSLKQERIFVFYHKIKKILRQINLAIRVSLDIQFFSNAVCKDYIESKISKTYNYGVFVEILNVW